MPDPQPNAYLLRQNHGYDIDDQGICRFLFGEHPIYGAMCLAQHLVSNHITYAATSKRGDQLTERMQRGRALGLDVDAIVRQARESAKNTPNQLDSIDQLD